MFGNFPVNDSWIFVRQIEAFREGIFTLSARLDPSFITQGFFGYIWSHFFGTSFTSFKILTFLVTLVGVFGFYKILEHLKVEKNKSILLSLLLFFNPLVFVSAFTFMTDNYFLTFVIYTVLYILKFQNEPTKKNSDGILRMLIFAVLVRQIGILIGIAFIISHLMKAKKKDDVTVLATVFSILFTLGIVYYWPRFEVNRSFILLEAPIIKERLQLLILSLFYIPIMLFPTIFGSFKKRAPLVLVIAALFAVIVYKLDVFPVGNVLYIENLYTKSDFRANFSLFDNIYFKVFISGVFGLAISKFIFMVKNLKVKMGERDLFLFLALGLNFLVLLISADFYDRYLIPSLMLSLILFSIYFSKNLRVNWKTISALTLMALVSIFLTWDYSAKNTIKWEHAQRLKDERGVISQVSLNDTYTAYALAQKTGDFTGLEGTRSFEKTCFIQEYSLDSENKFIKSIEDLQDKLLDNPKPYNSNKKNMPRVKNNLHKLIYKDDYFSPIYALVGKETYVGTWCLQ